jgi:small subunit ribosomal protein S4
MGEAQFSRYVQIAGTLSGKNTDNLMRLLETRVDNIVHRMGLASSRSEARQMVSHGLITVDGRKVTIPSYRTKPGQVIAPKNIEKFEELSLNTAVSWLDVDTKKYTATVKHLPSRDEIDTPVNESLIIEFYSR